MITYTDTVVSQYLEHQTDVSEEQIISCKTSTCFLENHVDNLKPFRLTHILENISTPATA
jgi:hypothetical protein